MKRLILIPLLAWLLLGQVGPVTPALVNGDSATHAFASTPTGVRTMLAICPSTNTNVIYIGDSNASSSRGWTCSPGGSFALPPLTAVSGGSSGQITWDLSKWYYYISTGDTMRWGYTR